MALSKLPVENPLDISYRVKLFIERPSSPQTCAICLDSVTNNALINKCTHQFCYRCILSWSKMKRECPLCKEAFTLIVYDINGDNEYSTYNVPIPSTPGDSFSENLFYVRAAASFISYPLLRTERQLDPPAFTPHFFNAGRQFFGYRTTRRVEPPALFLPNTAPPSANLRRNNVPRYIIYRYNYSTRPPNNRGRERTATPEFYRENEAQMHRLIPWIRRDITVIYRLISVSAYSSDIAQTRILELLKAEHILSQNFYYIVLMYLKQYTQKFIDELYKFARSPYDMIGYDRESKVYRDLTPIHNNSVNFFDPVGAFSSDRPVDFSTRASTATDGTNSLSSLFELNSGTSAGNRFSNENSYNSSVFFTTDESGRLFSPQSSPESIEERLSTVSTSELPDVYEVPRQEVIGAFGRWRNESPPIVEITISDDDDNGNDNGEDCLIVDNDPAEVICLDDGNSDPETRVSRRADSGHRRGRRTERNSRKRKQNITLVDIVSSDDQCQVCGNGDHSTERSGSKKCKINLIDSRKKSKKRRKKSKRMKKTKEEAILFLENLIKETEAGVKLKEESKGAKNDGVVFSDQRPSSDASVVDDDDSIIYMPTPPPSPLPTSSSSYPKKDCCSSSSQRDSRKELRKNSYHRDSEIDSMETINRYTDAYDPLEGPSSGFRKTSSSFQFCQLVDSSDSD